MVHGQKRAQNVSGVRREALQQRTEQQFVFPLDGLGALPRDGFHDALMNRRSSLYLLRI